MKAGTIFLLMLILLLAFNNQARSGTIKEETIACKITESVRQAVEDYVIKKYDSVKCSNIWQEIDTGVRKKCSRVDHAGNIWNFYIEIFCNGKFQICTEIFKRMDEGDWQNLTSGKP